MRSVPFRGFFVALALGSAVAFGCYTGPGVDTNRLPDPRSGVDGNDPSKRGKGYGPGDDDDGGAQTPRGLPCEVAAVVAANCMECHGAVPAGGAQNRLLTYEDFAAKPSDPAYKSVAALALARMKSSSRPMPPSGRLDSASIDLFSHWVSGGLVRGMCADPHGDDAGAGDDDDTDVDVDGDDDGHDPDPPPPVSRCSTSINPDAGDPAETMRPGEACITCHNPNPAAPLFELAGTLYPTAHEPDDCGGLADTTVVIIDGTGAVHPLKTNATGNFFFDAQLPRPYRALVVRGSTLREMQTPQTNGDCNSCHTERGSSGAPGRINIP